MCELIRVNVTETFMLATGGLTLNEISDIIEIIS